MNGTPSIREAPAAAAVRLTVTDDLVRSRGTVFFRLIFALPFLIWMVVWAIGALFAVIANWFVTLFQGEPSASLHSFLARFVRFSTHAYAFLNLAAEPLPAFDGRPGYPVDLEIDPPRRQNRWTVGFRIILVLPALFLVTAIAGTSSTFSTSSEWRASSLLATAAVFGWFFALFKARMDRGLRDLIAYALSYGAQFWAYLLVLTDRYPSSDPLTAIGPLPTRSDPVWMEVRDELRRSRLTVLFRLVLAIPHLVWLALWGLVAVLAAIVNWFATLISGTSPESLHRFLAAYTRYLTHVSAFLYLVGNPFPGFVGGDGTYPIDLHVSPRRVQNRWTVGFRLILAVPALILASVFSSLLAVIAVLGWFASLATGRMPLGLRNAGAFALRYCAQISAYLFLVSPAYPYSGPCLERAPAPEPAVAAPAA